MTPTPADQLQRTLRLCEVYRELKDEIVEEATQIEARVIRPATDARDCIQPIRKTIKKRENKRLDYEKQQDKVNKLTRKTSRTPKEDTQLARAQEDMATLAEVIIWYHPFENFDDAITNNFVVSLLLVRSSTLPTATSARRSHT